MTDPSKQSRDGGEAKLKLYALLIARSHPSR